MKKNKIILFSLLFLIALNTVFVVYLANFRYYVFNENYYKKQFEKNDVYDNVPEADKELDSLFMFFNDKKELDNNFFSENERGHLQDVKVLINKIIIIFYFLVFLEILFFILLYFLVQNKFLKCVKFVLLYSSGFVLLVSILFYIFSNNFQFIFIKFHEIFFPQGNWLFPYNSNLIILFPQQFFYGFFYKIIVNSFIVSLLIFVLDLLLFFKEK